MTGPAGLPTPAAVAEGWRVDIEMPVFDSGRYAGTPVGWLSLNKVPVGATAVIRWWKAKKAWREAAFQAYKRHLLPRGLDRIYVLIQFRFTDNRGQEPSNFEPTVKPIIDALRPQKVEWRVNPKTKRRDLCVDPGWGVIADDDQSHLVRGPEMPVGKPLGRKSAVKGVVTVFITPLPKSEVTHQ